MTGFDFVMFNASGIRLGLKKFKIDGNRGSALACISVKVARLPRDPSHEEPSQELEVSVIILRIEY